MKNTETEEDQTEKSPVEECKEMHNNLHAGWSTALALAVGIVLRERLFDRSYSAILKDRNKELDSLRDFPVYVIRTLVKSYLKHITRPLTKSKRGWKLKKVRTSIMERDMVCMHLVDCGVIVDYATDPSKRLFSPPILEKKNE